MAIVKITLIGMYQYMNDQNDPLFKNLAVPTGMDKDKLINAILYKGAEFGVLYADPYFMQSMIKIWSDRYAHTLERWSKALAIEYDPLENYDRHEEWSDLGVRSRDGSTSRIGTEIGKETTVNKNKTDQITAGTNSSNQTDDHKVSAYDSTAYQNKDKTDTDTKNTDTTVSSTGSTGDMDITGEQLKNENVNDKEKENNTAVHTGRIRGNIGTLTSQTMLESEFKVARFTLYDEAADLFLSEFCIYVY